MAWLIVCPAHRPGLFGLIYFFVILFYQPEINGTSEQKKYKNGQRKSLENYILAILPPYLAVILIDYIKKLFP
jgi:hypothetical protein